VAGSAGFRHTRDVPELSLTALTWINGALFVFYLPLGFMGWAFAAGGYANSPSDTTRQQRWVLLAALTPALVILAAAIAPHWLPEPWVFRVAWIPLGVVGLLLALTFAGAIVSGFVQGVRDEGPSEDE
jgi:hypothetical protein